MSCKRISCFKLRYAIYDKKICPRRLMLSYRTGTIVFMFYSVDKQWVWIDMSAEGRDEDDYIFTSRVESEGPYIEWNDETRDRSTKRCVALATGSFHGQHPRDCRLSSMKYICESEGDFPLRLSSLVVIKLASLLLQEGGN